MTPNQKLPYLHRNSRSSRISREEIRAVFQAETQRTVGIYPGG